VRAHQGIKGIHVMAINDYYSMNGKWNNSYQYCPSCYTYYFGYPHTCTVNPTPIFTQLEAAKPKYGEHILDCGCVVKTVVVEHCETLHKAPETE
jgi:hypothetical protein